MSGTTLSSMGLETTVRLVRHAYVLAMCNLHVLLDHPSYRFPTRSGFEAYVSERF